MLASVAGALALCGEVTEAERLAEELARRHPKATLVNAIYLPVIRAAIELQRGNAERAIQLLEVVTPYEGACCASRESVTSMQELASTSLCHAASISSSRNPLHGRAASTHLNPSIR
jgi:hypothetical protein